jgi:hypothetical protein
MSSRTRLLLARIEKDDSEVRSLVMGASHKTRDGNNGWSNVVITHVLYENDQLVSDCAQAGEG